MSHIHKKIDFTVGAFIVNNNKVLLVRHKELKIWLPVGGHIELDEDIDQALYREIREESGLKKSDIEILAEKPNMKARHSRFLFTPSYVDLHRINKSHSHIVFVYFVKSKIDKVKLIESEHHEIRWFSRNELKNQKYQLRSKVKFYAKEALKRIK